MKDNDKLDDLISSFQNITPEKEQTLKWYAAVERKRRQRRTLFQISASLAAGIAIGILCASFALKSFTQNKTDEHFNATFALISVKNLE